MAMNRCRDSWAPVCVLIVMTLCLATLPCASALGQCQPVEAAKIVPFDGVTGDLFFGDSVAVDGNVAVIGAAQDDTLGADAGAAYVYHHDGSTWAYETKLTASDGAAGDLFGISVAIRGDVMIVGAQYHDEGADNAGAAYVYRLEGGGWSFEDKLTAADPTANAWFGNSVAIDGDAAVVGAWGEGENGALAGAAYVFHVDAGIWSEEAKLTASDGEIVDFYGWAVAIEGDLAVVTAIGDDDAAGEAGAVYLYRNSGSVWGDEIKLIAADGAGNDQLGASLALAGDRLLAGAWGDDSTAGSVYVFHFDGPGWSEENKLTASDRLPGDGFSWSLAFDGRLAVIGADDRDDDGNSSGAAYLFRVDGATWSEEGRLNASDAAADDHFGWSVGVAGNTILVGAPNDDDTGESSGSAYFFAANCDIFTDGFESGDTQRWSATSP